MSLLSLFPDLPNPYRVPVRDVAELFDGDVLFSGDWERIGAHDWAFVIYRNSRWGPSCDYVWRRGSDAGQSCSGWQRAAEFHSYDRDKSDDGLPVSVKVLWHRAEAQRRQFGVS